MPVVHLAAKRRLMGLRFAETDEANEGGAEQEEQQEQEQEVEGAENLGDKGKKALDRMKAERNTARQEAAAAKTERDRLQAEIDGKQADFEAQQKAEQLKNDALAAANTRILKAEVRAAAANKLQDPADALLHIDLASFEVDDDGNVDTAAIAEAIDALVEAKPYLAAQSGRFQGGSDAGARKGDQSVTQLTAADINSMTPEQILTAKNAGRLNKLMGIN